MRAALAAAAVLALPLFAGCAPEDEQQSVARQAAEKWAGEQGGYEVEDTHCTDSASNAWLDPRFTEVYLCAVRREDGECDRVRVTFRDARIRVVLDRTQVSCTLPF